MGIEVTEHDTMEVIELTGTHKMVRFEMIDVEEIDLDDTDDK